METKIYSQIAHGEDKNVILYSKLNSYVEVNE